MSLELYKTLFFIIFINKDAPFLNNMMTFRGDNYVDRFQRVGSSIDRNNSYNIETPSLINAAIIEHYKSIIPGCESMKYFQNQTLTAIFKKNLSFILIDLSITLAQPEVLPTEVKKLWKAINAKTNKSNQPIMEDIADLQKMLNLVRT